MQAVGIFLSALFSDGRLPRRSSLSSTSHTRSVTSYSLSHEITQFLHYCPRYTQSKLIQTVIGICSGVPEAFEVFRCQPQRQRENLACS